MSIRYGNTQFAEAMLPELELNKETLRDLEVDGSQVRGGGKITAYACVAQPAPPSQGTTGMTITTACIVFGA